MPLFWCYNGRFSAMQDEIMAIAANQGDALYPNVFEPANVLCLVISLLYKIWL